MGMMMFESLVIIAAITAATDCSAARTPIGREAGEMTYDAFVAVEESPGLAAIIKPTVLNGPAIVLPARAMPIV
jgi:hypothetical protein